MSEKEQTEAPGKILEEISNVAREFRKQISLGKSPRIEKYLTQLAPVGRENLFENLLATEVAFRRGQGETPTSKEYIQRFPNFKQQVRRAFFEPTMDSVDLGSSTDGDDHTEPLLKPRSASHVFAPTYELPDANRLGDYELIRELGRGGMGIVYEARHLASRNRVALKTLPTGGDGQQVNADKLYRFRKEFRRLSEINHPNLVGMQSLEVDGNRWFFTMDLIDGEDFLEYVRPDERLDEERLRACVKQLATGIMELHHLGIIHRDLKPSNVLVSHEGHVTILDFGLAAQLQKTSDMTQTKSAMFAGTPPYAAPEQVFGERTEASDWYAFGTMLFEALEGERPFQEQDPVALLRKKQEQDPPTLSERNELPSDLSELADGLLRREPGLRLASHAIGHSLGLEDETQLVGSTRDSQSSMGSIDAEDVSLGDYVEEEVILVGREKQLAQLDEIKQGFQKTQQPFVVWVTGKSGEGKSSLVETFLRPIRQGQDMLILSGRCYDRESVPFKAIDSVIEPLTSYLRSKSADWLANHLPQDFHLLAKLFPILSRVKSIGEMSKLDRGRIDERQIRYRAFYALRELLQTIGRATPLVVFLDDLQWGDSDSAEVALELLAPPNPAPILFVGGYRSDEAESSPFIQQWEKVSRVRPTQHETRQVSVEPLSEEQCLELVAARVGFDADRLRQQSAEVFSDTRGNPYFIEQLIEGFDSSADRFEHVPLDRVIERKLARLPRESTELLRAIAVAGQAVPLDEASQVAGMDASGYAVITHMRSERLVRLVGTKDRYLVDTYHDKIRETVLEGLDKRAATVLHSRYAGLLEAQTKIEIDELYQFFETAEPYERYPVDTERAFDLAYHFERAGDGKKAFGYSMLAAEQAAQSYANDEATGEFAHAEMLLPEDIASRVHYRLFLGIGLTHRRSKRTKEAIPKLEQAIKLAESPFDIAVANAELGHVYDQLGRPSKAVQAYELASELAKDPFRKSTMRKLLSIAFNSFRTIMLPATWQRYRSEEKRRWARLREAIWNRAWINYVDSEGVISGFDACLRASIAGIQIGEPTSIAISHANSALAWSSIGSRWLGNLFLARSRRVNSRVRDRVADAQVSFADAFSCYWLGDLESSRSGFQQILEDLERCGNYADLGMAWHLSRHIEAYIGSSSSERAVAEKARQLAYEVGSAQRLCWGGFDIAAAYCREGKFAPSLDSISKAYDVLSDDVYLHTEAIWMATQSYVTLQASDYESSTKFSLAAWELNRKGLVLVDSAMLSIPLMVESHVGPNWLEPAPKSELKPLKRTIRLANIFYFTLPNQQSHILRVRGRAAMVLGKRRKAIRKFQKSIKLAIQKGMDYQRAKALLDLAAVKEEGRDKNRFEAIELLKKMESVIPRAESWLLGDQYDEDVVAPEFDIAAWENEHGRVGPEINEESR